MSPILEPYYDNLPKWKPELLLLREICISCELKEELKWKAPCFTFEGKNILILHAFKDYFGIGFFKGALIKDINNLLQFPGENSHHSKILKFQSSQEIVSYDENIRRFIYEAIEIEKKGLKVIPEKNEKELPSELIEVFQKNTIFKQAFETLSPGKKRGYLLYFSGAKQSQTKLDRIHKMMPRILLGKGIQDCTCGLSKKMPKCDGSHKYIESLKYE